MLTIVIPTIGRADSFERALKSACRTCDEVVKQILIVDNSQSAFLSQLNISCSLDNRIKVLSYNERKSMADSWNTALHQVTQPWVLFLHDDDELISEKFRELRLENFNPADVSFIAFDYYRRRNRYKRLVARGSYDKNNLCVSIIKSPPTFVSTIFSLSALRNIGGWNMDYGYFLDLVGYLELAKYKTALFEPSAIGVYTVDDPDQLSAIENRASSYGDYIPAVTAKVFQLCDDVESRKTLINLLSTFVYPLSGSRFSRRVKRVMTAIKNA